MGINNEYGLRNEDYYCAGWNTIGFFDKIYIFCNFAQVVIIMV